MILIVCLYMLLQRQVNRGYGDGYIVVSDVVGIVSIFMSPCALVRVKSRCVDVTLVLEESLVDCRENFIIRKVCEHVEFVYFGACK